MPNDFAKVIGVEVEPKAKSRTVRIKLTLENNEVFAAELSLPTVTRLTNQLVDAEFYERCEVGLFPLSENAASDAPPDLRFSPVESFENPDGAAGFNSARLAAG